MSIYKQRIVLFDRDETFLALLQIVLKVDQDFVLVNSYSLRQEMLKGLIRDTPDILVADLDYYRDEEALLIREIKRTSRKTQLLILTDIFSQSKLLEIISAGATGALKKSSCLSQLKDSLNAMATGGSPVDPLISRMIIDSLQTDHSPVLSGQEQRILRLLSQGLNSSGIAVQLGISIHTSRTHMKNIYKKLNVSSKQQAIKKAKDERLIPIFG